MTSEVTMEKSRSFLKNQCQIIHNLKLCDEIVSRTFENEMLNI